MTRENVLFVTLDSCRLDTAIKAQTPNLDFLGPMIPCFATATFTLPAHLSFFAGFLPVPMIRCTYLGGYDRLWRSRAARPSSLNVYEWISKPTIIEHYREFNYSVLGIGGVQFFDPANGSNILPYLFDRFDYYGVEAGAGLGENGKSDTIFTSTRLEDLVDAALGAEPFFAFANLSETHFPYLSPGCTDNSLTQMALSTIRSTGPDKVRSGYTEHELLNLLRPARLRQMEALQWIDKAFARATKMLTRASRPTVVVVCADHGESFGENGFIGHGHPAPEVMNIPMWIGRIDVE